VLLKAVMTYGGNLTNPVVADTLHLEYKPIKGLIK
jgi:hypothetical protein